MELNYVVYKLDIEDIENNSDWFDKDGCLKYKEKYLFKTFCESGVLEKAQIAAVFFDYDDATQFCKKQGFSTNSYYFYFCTRGHYSLDAEMGEYIEVRY